MQAIQTELDGCYLISPLLTKDCRGSFVKTFHSETFDKLGLTTNWQEEYYSISRKGVIRGMHFQSPPHDHEKLVYCLRGKVLDVVVDLRKQSRSYGRHFAVQLDSANCEGIFIPKGMAHGFLALADDTLLSYKVSTIYAPKNDAGILWNSLGIDWGENSPIVSERDRKHPGFIDFKSPF